MSINTAFCANTIASDATCVPTIEQRRLTCPVLRKSNTIAYATSLRRPYPFTYFNTQLVTALSTMPDALHSILRLFQCNKKERTAVLSGLDAVGKTTLLYKLKLGMVVQTVIPTIGLNVETIRCPSKLSRSKLTLTCWDVGATILISTICTGPLSRPQRLYSGLLIAQIENASASLLRC